MKILLIEDRTKRQELFIENTNINLASYDDIVDNTTGKSYKEFSHQILQNDSILNRYDIIISHKSAFEDNNIVVLTILENHCKIHNKPLIYFSGGIAANSHNHDEYERLILNSKTFYSQNLKIFLDNVRKEQQNIMMLCYGDRWKLNIVLNTLEKLNSFIEDNLEKDMLRTDRVPITNLVKVTDSMEKDKISMKEIKEYRDSLFSYIKELSNE